MEPGTHKRDYSGKLVAKDVAERASWLLSLIQPTQNSARMRAAAQRRVARVICDCFGEGTLVCVQGSFPQRVYLSTSDIDLVIFNPKIDPESWPHTLVEFIQRNESKLVTRVKVISSAEVKLVKVFTQDVTIDITRGRLGGVYAALLYERVDAIFGKCHLFKRSCVLLKAFLKTEMRILGSSAGMLSSTALQALLLHFFLQCAAIDCTPTSPLGALAGFLEYYSNIDLSDVVVFSAGLVKRKDLDGLSPSTAANKCISGFIGALNHGMTPSQKQSDYHRNRDAYATCLTAASSTISGSHTSQKPIHVNAAFYPTDEVSKLSLYVAPDDLYPLPCASELGRPVTLVLGTISMLGRILEECDSAWKDSVGEGTGTGYEDDPACAGRMQSMWHRPFCIADPLAPYNNVGRSVSFSNAQRITKVFKISAAIFSSLAYVNDCDVKTAVAIFDALFRNTLLSLRYQKPSQLQLQPSRLIQQSSFQSSSQQQFVLTEPNAFRGDEEALVKQITDLANSFDNKKPAFQMPLLPGQLSVDFPTSKGGWDEGPVISSPNKVRIKSVLHRKLEHREISTGRPIHNDKRVQLGQTPTSFRIDIIKPGFLSSLVEPVESKEPQIKFAKPKSTDDIIIVLK